MLKPLKGSRTLKDSNPRHLILEINILPTELRILYKYYCTLNLKKKQQSFYLEPDLNW